MGEHLASWQIAEFILGGLDEDEIEGVYRHFDECAEGVSWLSEEESQQPGALPTTSRGTMIPVPGLTSY